MLAEFNPSVNHPHLCKGLLAVCSQVLEICLSEGGALLLEELLVLNRIQTSAHLRYRTSQITEVMLSV